MVIEQALGDVKMKQGRRYISIGLDLRKKLVSQGFEVGDKIPTEREIAEEYDVSRTVVREAIIMLELEGLVEVRKGSGVYVTALPGHDDPSSDVVSQFDDGDIGPFEMLQGRQLVESNVAELAAHHITKAEIFKLRQALQNEKNALDAGESSDQYDKEFHLLIAQASKNSFLIEVFELMWSKRNSSKMWQQLHSHISSSDYCRKWIDDHGAILAALQKKDPAGAKRAMWTHLENVKTTLFELSDVSDEGFDGYLFESYPLS